MPLEVVEAPDREVAIGGEHLRVVAVERRAARLVGRFTLEVAFVLQLHRPVAGHLQVVADAVAALHDQALVAPLRLVGVAVDRVVERPEELAVADDVGGAVVEGDEVLDEALHVARHVGQLHEGARRDLAAQRRRELARHRRVEAVLERDVGGGERAVDDLRVVVDVEARREVHADAGRTRVGVADQARVGDVGVAGELRLAVLAGVVGVGALDHEPAVALGVEGRGQARDHGVGVGADDVAGGVAAHALVAQARVDRQPAVHRPPVVGVERGRLDVDAARRASPASCRGATSPGTNRGISRSWPSNTGTPALFR